MYAITRMRPSCGIDSPGHTPSRRLGVSEAVRVTSLLVSGVMIVSMGLIEGIVANEPRSEEASRAAPDRYSVVQVTDGGSISGTVRLDLIPDVRRTLTVSTNQDICGNEVADLSAAIGPHGQLQWAFVYLEGVTQGKAF